MPSINWVEVAGQVAEAICDEFPEASAEKLQTLTAEEMFYLHKVMTYEIPPKRKPDVMMLTLKRRVKLWLEDKQARPGLPFEHLRKYWQEEFFALLQGEMAHV